MVRSEGLDKAAAIDAIVEAAIGVFAQWGYKGASLRAIANTAGVPLSTIDNYFGSKNRLYRSLMRMVWAEVARDRRIALEAHTAKNGSEPPTLEQVIEALAEPIVRRAMSNDPALRDRVYFLQQRYREHRALNVAEDIDRVDDQVRPFIEAFLAATPEMAVAMHERLQSVHVPTLEYLRTAKHPSMHKTDSLNYFVCVSGRIRALSEGRDVLLEPGDFIIQHGCMHGWWVESDEPAVIAAVLIDAKV